MLTTTVIRLDNTIDWGCHGSDEERAAYEAKVIEAIQRAYPEATVVMQCLQISRPRCVVTTRDEEGRILTNDFTAQAEEDISESVLEIARNVWDEGGFWSEYIAMVEGS